MEIIKCPYPWNKEHHSRYKAKAQNQSQKDKDDSLKSLHEQLTLILTGSST